MKKFTLSIIFSLFCLSACSTSNNLNSPNPSVSPSTEPAPNVSENSLNFTFKVDGKNVEGFLGGLTQTPDGSLYWQTPSTSEKDNIEFTQLKLSFDNFEPEKGHKGEINAKEPFAFRIIPKHYTKRGQDLQIPPETISDPKYKEITFGLGENNGKLEVNTSVGKMNIKFKRDGNILANIRSVEFEATVDCSQCK